MRTPDGDGQIAELLTHLEHKLVELDQLREDLARDAEALVHAVRIAGASSDVGADAGAANGRSVYSIREAAQELGVSTSMLHKLLKNGQLGYLKVGARTLITQAHLEHLYASAEADRAAELLTNSARARRRSLHSRRGVADGRDADGVRSVPQHEVAQDARIDVGVR